MHLKYCHKLMIRHIAIIVEIPIFTWMITVDLLYPREILATGKPDES